MKNRPINILLIEDNPEDARLIKELLKDEARGSYHLKQADRLLIGLERLAAEKFDVVFLDLGLPDSKGMDTLKAVTQKSVRLPVIVVTGLDDETTAIAAMRSGAQDYLLKGRMDGSVLWRVLNYAIERKQTQQALINSEEKYRSVVENAGEAIMISQRGLIKFVNSKTIEVLGYSEEEIISKPFIEFIHPADRQLSGEQDTRRMKGEEAPLGYELRFIDSDGQTKWVDFNAINTDWEGRPATLNFIRDITDSRHAEKALIVSVEKYRALFEDSMDAIFVTTTGGRFIDVNQSMCNLFGYTMDEMLALPVLSLYSDPGCRDVFQEEVEAKGGVRDFEVSYRKKNGTIIKCLMAATVWRQADGKALGYRGIVHDITERKQAEEAAKQSAERFRLAIDATEEGLWEWDILTGKEFFAPRWCEIIGYSFDDPELPHTFKAWASRIHPDDHDRVMSAMTNHLEKGTPYDVDYRHQHRSGEYRWQNSKGKAVFAENGKPTIMVGCISDITHRKKAEEELQESYESLKKTLNDAINTMVKIVELRDPYTAGHQQKVTDLATAIAGKMELKDIQIDQLRMAAVIHDIGKMYVPSDILSKPGRLSDMEFSLIKAHSQAGYDIVKGMDFPCNIAKTVLQHHERLDGSGYPNGLKGEDTLLEAKILAVADVVEAMVSHRPYRPALGLDKALEEISKNRGRLYDADVVGACLKLFKKDGFEFKEPGMQDVF